MLAACAVFRACSGAGNVEASSGDSGLEVELWLAVFGVDGLDG
ncbi:hypothetical protein M879_07845 [Mycobacteroides abscessus V06705]|nr:hypothetical protein M879_07845 [Mycobacteroides abscessus V06705]